MNLCMIAPEFLPIWGGTGSYVVELLKNLPKDIEVHVVTLKRKNPGTLENSSIEDYPKYVFNRDMYIHYVSYAKETFFYNLGFQIACFRKIPKLHKEYKFDVLHSQFGHMSDVLLQLLKKVHVPCITTVHGTIALQNEVSRRCGLNFGELEWSEKQVRLFYPALRTLELLYAKHVSKFIAASNVIKNRILTDLEVEPDRVCTVYNGVDTMLFCMPKKNEEEKKHWRPTVVYMGRIMAKKGLRILIKAMPKILSEKPGTHFMFVGGGNILFYRKMIQKMGIPENNFSFVGHVGYFERPKILGEATVFVNPSFFENCSLSILEAMSCGTAVVASDVGGNPEIIESGKNGLLVPISDDKKLAESIISLLRDENFNKKIGKEARGTVETSFSSRKTAKETCRIYKQVVG